ncbi:Meckel syndrome type 1 protein [Lysobacter sp. yr284]|uniref:hypothetical protein n=1 Tax=Lysobacter sp. yr284 TaxID=1761791 RepID=UPI00089957AC|nr:hypothetical protein [Lysobacter sp. yr284]SDZ15898.1 Meckel syndrome type 1 protein [Lysobacter sp. yr284]
MKISAPPSPPLPAPAAGAAPRGQERGPFQQLVQRLEQDMWSGAAAGDAPGAAPAPRIGARAPLAAAAPAVVRPLAHLRDPGLPAGGIEPQPQYGLRDIVEASAAAAAVAVPAAARGNGSGVAFAALVAPPPARAGAAAGPGDAGADEAARVFHASAAPPREESAGDRLSLLAAPGGFGLALRLREDRPLDADLLKRALARVLHEHGASLMRLTINGTDASLFQGETPHGD